jgi:oligopeptide transport system substrate-binding protein
MGMTMYQENKLDLMGGAFLPIPLKEIPHIQASPNLKEEYSVQSASGVWLFGINTANPPMDNLSVRKAIAAAIDRQLFTDLVTSGSRYPTTTITPPSIFGNVLASENVGISFEPVNARKWLAEAGYPDGEGFPTIQFLVPGEGDSNDEHEYRTAIQTFLKHYLNIEVNFIIPKEQMSADPAAGQDFGSLIAKSHFFLFGYKADYADADNFLRNLFHSASDTSVNGWLHWENKEFDRLVDDALLTDKKVSPAENIKRRKANYQRAEEILCEEHVVVIPFFYETVPVLIKSRVKDWKYNPIGGQKM